MAHMKRQTFSEMIWKVLKCIMTWHKASQEEDKRSVDAQVKILTFPEMLLCSLILTAKSNHPGLVRGTSRGLSLWGPIRTGSPGGWVALRTSCNRRPWSRRPRPRLGRRTCTRWSSWQDTYKVLSFNDSPLSWLSQSWVSDNTLIFEKLHLHHFLF